MSIRASLLSLVIVAGCYVGAAAQSGSPVAPPMLLAPDQPAHDSRNQIPLVGQGGQIPGQIPDRQHLRLPQEATVVIPASPSNSVCYTIRSYNFVQDGPSPDATRFKDSTTCEPAAKLRMKSTRRTTR